MIQVQKRIKNKRQTDKSRLRCQEQRWPPWLRPSKWLTPSLALAPRPARPHTAMAEGCVWGCVCYKLVTLIERVLRGVAEGRSCLSLPQQQAEGLLSARRHLRLQRPPSRRAAGSRLGATGRPAALPGRTVETGWPRLGG